MYLPFQCLSPSVILPLVMNLSEVPFRFRAPSVLSHPLFNHSLGLLGLCSGSCETEGSVLPWSCVSSQYPKRYSHVLAQLYI